MKFRNTIVAILTLAAAFFALRSFAFAQAPAASTSAAAPSTAEPEPHQMSASDLNQQITNPVGSLWSLQSQFQNFKLSNGQWNNVWNFQPSLPVSLTKDWNLITRTVLPFYNIVPHETAPGEFKRTAGFGDITLSETFSPAHAGNWLLGAGPTFIFPAASSTFTGQGKVAVGPVGLLGYVTKDFILAVFPQQWFAIAGSRSRPYTSNLNLQPIAAMFFGDGWDVGYSGNILANWRAPSGDVWTVPVGLNIGKVVKFGLLPVKLQFAVQYMAVHPNSGEKYNLQIQITPVIPKLIKGTLFD
jgi:hypothetical protein